MAGPRSPIPPLLITLSCSLLLQKTTCYTKGHTSTQFPNPQFQWKPPVPPDAIPETKLPEATLAPRTPAEPWLDRRPLWLPETQPPTWVETPYSTKDHSSKKTRSNNNNKTYPSKKDKLRNWHL